jgi:hypothetical protein
MKRLSIRLLLVLLSVYGGVKAQNKNQLSLQLSFNQFELAYQHSLFIEKMWGEVFAGVGNQDINSRFDDFLTGVRIGYNVFSNEKNLLAFNTKFGVYIPHNDYYTATTPLIGVGIRYTRFIGQAKKQSVFVSTGYQYGRRDYKQEYSSELIHVATVGTFNVAPVYFSLGYGVLL